MASSTTKKKIGAFHVPVGRDGALVESIAFNRRVVGSTPALAVRRDLGQVLYLQLPGRETPIQYPCCSRERL